MGIWVRSQDRKYLGNYKFIYVCHEEVKGETSLDVDILGRYETPERAMEVLNDIEERLIRGTERDVIEGNRRVKSNFVFNMPER